MRDFSHFAPDREEEFEKETTKLFLTMIGTLLHEGWLESREKAARAEESSPTNFLGIQLLAS
jgi:hypothetical protein